MYYEASDLLETADSDTLKQIARTRKLTREYYFSDHEDTEKRTAILHELLGFDRVKCADLYIVTPGPATGKTCTRSEGTPDNIF